METVSFVILHYKDEKITDSCVQSILQMKDQNRIQIVIVDNDIEKKNSERKSFAVKYEDNPRITVIQVNENGGFSHANNQGYRYSREVLEASYIVVLNNDIQFLQTDFLQILEESYFTNPCHVLGADILCERNGEHQNPLDTRIRTRKEAEFTVRMNDLALKLFPVVYPILFLQLKWEEKRRVKGKILNKGFYQKVQKDIVPFGACLIFTPDFVKQEEVAFIPETRFFYEEYILSYRCKKKGYRINYDPALKVIHEHGAATAKTFQDKKKRIKFMIERTKEAGEIYLKLITGG